MLPNQILCTLLLGCVLATAHAGELPKGDFKAELNGGHVAYTIAGQGPPMMVLTNTWGLERKRLQAIFKMLEPHFTMVYYDLRGMGDSSPASGPEDYGTAGARRELEALRLHLKLDKVYVLGWSAGAMNGLLYAAEHSDTLIGAVLVHGLSYVDPSEAQQVAEKHGAFFQRRTEVLGGLIGSQAPLAEKDAVVKRFLVDEWFPYMCADREAGKALIKQYFEPGNYSWTHMFNMFSDLGTFDARGQLAKITCPTLLISGQEDVFPPEIVARDAKPMAKGSHVNLQRSGHFGFIEEPEAFLKAVLEWRAKL